MQQPNTPQEQYGHPHQIVQPVMICPIQYVYPETPMLMPQAPEGQIQPNQTVVYNVQNPPPWIQNRPPSQVVYVQQVPSSYQTYFHPHMMQNTYHPQVNYQIQQPMMTQDNRQFVQIPNMTPFNMVQSQPAQPSAPQQQTNNDEPAERMPLLSQILKQKSNSSDVAKAPATNNIRPTIPTVNNVNMLAPITQNQQVQTNIRANNRGRPRKTPPQVISINPMQQPQFVNVNQNPDVIINIATPVTPNMRPEVPQHIRSKIPSSISVKSLNKPIQFRPMVRPYDVISAPQHFIYNPYMLGAPAPETRNIMTNTDRSYSNQGNINPRPSEVNVQTQVPEIGKTPTTNNQDETSSTRKEQVDANVNSNSDLVKTRNDNVDSTNTDTSTENQTQKEEKLIRNTVYVQARGRVLSDAEILQNQTLKRTVGEKLDEGRTANNANGHEEETHKSNKYAKIEVADGTSQTNNSSANSSATKVPVKCKTQQSKKSNLCVNCKNENSTDSNTSKSDMASVPLSLNSHKPETPNVMKEVNTGLEQKKSSNKNSNPSDDKLFAELVTLGKVPNFVKDNFVLKETYLKNQKEKRDKIKILTHVLDGYIIQESNVAFPIYKPIMEKEIRLNTAQEKDKSAETNDKADNANETKHNNEPHSTLGNLNTRLETEKETEVTAVNKDDPFANIQKSTVESWTVEQLAAHLEKFDWKETAAKLQDQEIDGESFLLVKKDQLIDIGVCEKHAEIIAAFSAS